MQFFFFRVFVFALLNFIAFWVHWWVFKTNHPYLAWGTAIVHLIVLIFFPYTKYFRPK
jgi:hypothetical protein